MQKETVNVETDLVQVACVGEQFRHADEVARRRDDPDMKVVVAWSQSRVVSRES